MLGRLFGVACYCTAAPLNLDDVIRHRSERSDGANLLVTIHELPDYHGPTIIPERDGYAFWYRHRAEKGETRVTIPELNLSDHHISRDHIPVLPPSLPVHSKVENVAGLVTRFSFSPRFFESLGNQVGLPMLKSNGFWHDFFALDQRLEALCWLLMEETESKCPHGPLYFEPLANALAVGVLSKLRDQHRSKARTQAVPPGVVRAVQRLETEFARELSLTELAAQAQLSISHFRHGFRQLTGHSPHQYLLLVRLSHARKLLAQENEAMSLSEIALSCGFWDQAHLIRHFRRYFGMTPGEFRHRHRPSPNPGQEPT